MNTGYGEHFLLFDTVYIEQSIHLGGDLRLTFIVSRPWKKESKQGAQGRAVWDPSLEPPIEQGIQTPHSNLFLLGEPRQS